MWSITIVQLKARKIIAMANYFTGLCGTQISELEPEPHMLLIATNTMRRIWDAGDFNKTQVQKNNFWDTPEAELFRPQS